MKRSAWFSIAILGLSTGWLIGLSVSPVIGTVITALLGFAGAMVSVYSCVTENSHRPLGEINPAPVALLALTIALAATLGSIIRQGAPIVNAGTDSEGRLVGITLFSGNTEVCVELLRANTDSLPKLLSFYADDSPVFAALASASNIDSTKQAIKIICKK